MAWTQLQYSRKEVNEAGKYLQLASFDAKKFEHAIEVIDNFRVAHAFPLNTLQNNLRTHANNIDNQSIIAQRLKRFYSIYLKLNRFKTMELWDIQDIGGCRAIVPKLDDVQRLVDAHKSSRIRHYLSHEDDYIKQPRYSGYRSRHLVYRYFSDRNDIYNGLKIEIQIRTILQHAWATAVETVDAFTKQALKSSRGRRDWERFFQLMGTEMAFREGTQPVPNTPNDRIILRQELRKCAEDLRVKALLVGFANALRSTAPEKDAKYFLLSLDAAVEHLSITGYESKELVRASKDYAKIERQIQEKREGDAVLVSVNSIHNLRRAYPNYFADTTKFIEILNESVKV